VRSIDEINEETYDSNKMDPEYIQQHAIANLNQQRYGQKNFFYPKVTILSYGQNEENQQSVTQSFDYSLTPISQRNLKINVEKELEKLSSQRKGVSIPQSHLDSVNNSQTNDTHALTQSIFKPRMVNRTLSN